MTSLSTDARWLSFCPLLWRKRLHRQGMNLFAHSLAKCPVDNLVLLYPVLVPELGTDDDGFKMLAVAYDFDMFAGKAFLNVGLDGVGAEHGIRERLALGSQLVAASNHQQGRE